MSGKTPDAVIVISWVGNECTITSTGCDVLHGLEAALRMLGSIAADSRLDGMQEQADARAMLLAFGRSRIDDAIRDAVTGMPTIGGVQ